MDPMLAKAESVSDGGGIPVIIYLRREKNCCTTAARREEWKYVQETTLQIPRSAKKERKEVLQAAEQRFPCSLWRRPWWGSLSPCSPWRSIMEQISTPNAWRTPCRSRCMWPAGDCDPMETPWWSRILGGPVTPWPMLEQVFWKELWSHGESTLEKSVPEGLHSIERTHDAAVCGELQHVGRTSAG